MYEVKNVSFGYSKEIKQVENIDLHIESGECILLTGGSGCGKTTLTRILNGLIPNFYEGIFNGKVKFLGKDLSDYKKGELAKYVGNVFQDPRSQFFSSQVADEIALVGENLGMKRDLLIKRVQSAAKAVGMEKFLYNKLHTLSGGQKQKVAIASTLVFNNEVIILDEPSANLDYASTLELRDILAKLKKAGKTIIIAEHRLFYLKDLFDRMIYMKNGKIHNIFQKEEAKLLDYKDLGLRQLSYESLQAEKENKLGKVEAIFSNIRVEVSDRTLMDKVSFQLHENEIMAVVGENGVGKSTMAKMLCGLKNIKKGETSLGKTKKQRLLNTYYVMQDPDTQLFYESVEKEMLAGQETEESIEKAKFLLKKLDLWKHRFDIPQELSIGEKQRLCVAIACMKKSKVLILDEPTAGLDLKRMEAVAEVLNDKAKECAMLIISHDLEFILKVCNSVMLLTSKGMKVMKIRGNENELFSFFKI